MPVSFRTARNLSVLSQPRLRLPAGGVLLLGGMLLAGAVHGADGPHAGEEVAVVRAKELANTPGTTMKVVAVSYAPGAKSAAHQHAGSVFGYVLSGAVRSENSATGAARVYQARESFFEPAGSKHLVSENASAMEPAKMLVLFLAEDGARLTTFGAAGSPALGTAAPAVTPAELIDDLNRIFGKQTTGRATHAKGIVLEGRFIPNPGAATLSKAPHFQRAVPVTVRFSNTTGIPTIPDADPNANPRGMAVKFRLPDGSDTDIVAHSYNGFPAPTVEEFHRFLAAVSNSGPGAPKPTPIETYLASHPAAKAFVTEQGPPPASFATLSYFGVNSFKFTNAKGKAQFGRYRLEPQAGLHSLTADEAAKVDPGYLAADVLRRVKAAPIRFNLMVQLPEAGDRIEDPSTAWPDTRRKLKVGVIEITAAVADSETAQRALLFQPGALSAGIEPADPMIRVRTDAYSVSFDRRHH